MFFALAQPQVPHQLGEVLKRRIVGVPVWRKGGVVSVDIQGHRKEFWHHRVVGDQGGEGRVVLQESLDFVARLVSDNNVVGDPLRMETLRHPEREGKGTRLTC